MSNPAVVPARPFGAVLTAMVTPFAPDGSVDFAAVEAVARHLVDSGCDGLIVHGTTGEAPTTSVDEKLEIARVIRATVGPDTTLVVGCGGNNTAADVAAVHRFDDISDGLLIATPYYSKPTQEGIIAHTLSLVEATDKPVMLYDIPGRCASEYTTETLITLGAHEQIVAVKDAKDDLFASTRVMRETDLAYYSGSDQINLHHLVQGGAGFVSVIGHVVAGHLAAMVAAMDDNDWAFAATIHEELYPVTEAIMTRAPGACAVKAGLHHLGVLPSRDMRLPLVPVDDHIAAAVATALDKLPSVAELKAQVNA